MNPRQNQSQQRGNASNVPNQPVNPHRHHGQQSQSHQTNSAGSYAPVGTPSAYGQPNQPPVNTAHDPQSTGYTNDATTLDQYARSPVGDGGSGSIRQTPGQPNPRAYIDDRNAPRMGQQVTPALQQSLSSRGTGSALQTTPYLTAAPHHQHEHRGSHGHSSTAGMSSDGQRLYPVPAALDTSHQPSHVRSGNAASLHNVQGQHHYAGAPVQPPARDMVPGPSGYSRPSNICRIPDCSRPGFFNTQIQEQLDYCEEHLNTALGGYAATCRGCRSFPVLENSDYCSRYCAGGGRSAALVPLGFAPACQECRRVIPENMPIYDGSYCTDCWNYHRRANSTRR